MSIGAVRGLYEHVRGILKHNISLILDKNKRKHTYLFSDMKIKGYLRILNLLNSSY